MALMQGKLGHQSTSTDLELLGHHVSLNTQGRVSQPGQ